MRLTIIKHKRYNKSTSRHIFFILLCCSLISFSSGCKKFVEIAPPTTGLVAASTFSSNYSATAAQTVIYSQMMNKYDPYYLAQDNGLLADELTNYTTNASIIQYYTNDMLAANNPGLWNDFYNYVYQVNAIIAGLQTYSGVSSAVKQQLTGESEFVRAFCYFYLTNCYGDVPLVLTTDYTNNANIARTSQEKVYQQIIADLNDAQGLLNSNYVDASDTAITQDRVRPTKWAAMALLARVYLFTGDYADAMTQATAVINNTSLYSLCPNLNKVFLANSTEAIWQLMIPLPSSTYATPDAFGFTLIAAPAGTTGLFRTSTISPQLLSSFETNDNRKSSWISYYASGTDTFYFPYKYKVYQGTAPSEYEMVLRLAEQYLIRAEAEANGAGNGITAAIADLNTIRERAGLPPYSGATDQASVLSAILHERQVELFTEWGHRWFDLIRTGNATNVMSSVTHLKGGTWTTSDTLYPIPQSEISVDNKLTQNDGY